LAFADAKRVLSPRAIVRLRTIMRGLGVPRWGNLRRLKPFSDYYGFDRGTPIDRYYLDRFLTKHVQAIQGDVLEIQSPGYVDKYGTNVRLKHSIDMNAAMNPTYVCDLAAADVVPSDRYDCFLLPNTLCVLRDIRNCMRHMLRVVKPGGVVLAATAAMGPLQSDGMDFWRMSAQGWQELAADVWAGHDYRIEAHGNCLAVVAAMLGLAQEELAQEELEYQDDRYPALVTLYCRKISLRRT
jgi:SAM-dependent methyltransferase